MSSNQSPPAVATSATSDSSTPSSSHSIKPILTPTSTPVGTPNPDSDHSHTKMDLNGLLSSAKIDEARTEKKEEEQSTEVKKTDEPQTNGVTESASTSPENKNTEATAPAKEVSKEKTKCKK